MQSPFDDDRQDPWSSPFEPDQGGSDGTGAINTPTPASSPWWTAPKDGNWENWFRTNLGRDTLTPAELIGLEGDLNKAGVKVLRNASGVAGKIQLPDGTTVDLIQAAGAGGNRLQWLVGGGDTAAQVNGAPITVDPSYLTPWDREFGYGDFAEPDEAALLRDPSYKWRVSEGAGMLQNSAAARGLLGSGGTLYDLLNLGQKMGSQEYSNVRDRLWNTYQANRDQAWRKYVEDKDTFYRNQSNPFDKLFRTASMGQSAAAV